MKKDLSLYIHIPFCNSKCNYCSFVSHVGTDEDKNRYIKNLKKEIILQAKNYNSFYNVRTIFIGGGTPSCLKLGQIKEIMQTVYKYFTVRNDAEITIELNPNTITKEKVREYILAGINRFSIGLQCASQNVLTEMGRTHTQSDFDNAIKIIRDHGISNINADIIIGYPNQKMSDVTETVKYLIELNIPHISTYMLSVEEGTKLYNLVDKQQKILPSETQVIKMYNTVYTTLKKYGYNRYEVSNFAKPGFMCSHNLVYWNREEYLGLGVAAHSFIDEARFSNTEKIKLYNECIENKSKPPTANAKKLTKQEKKEEFVMLALRTAQGLDTNKYYEIFKENFISKYKDKLSNFIKLKLLVVDRNGVIKATNTGFLVLNKIILELCS